MTVKRFMTLGPGLTFTSCKGPIFLAGIRQGWKGLQETNTLAYQASERDTLTGVKLEIVFALLSTFMLVCFVLLPTTFTVENSAQVSS
jgi:hypothetical protein